MQIYIYENIREYKHTYIHKYIHSIYIHTYIHTCIYTLIHEYSRRSEDKSFGSSSLSANDHGTVRMYVCMCSFNILLLEYVCMYVCRHDHLVGRPELPVRIRNGHRSHIRAHPHWRPDRASRMVIHTGHTYIHTYTYRIDC